MEWDVKTGNCPFFVVVRFAYLSIEDISKMIVNEFEILASAASLNIASRVSLSSLLL